MRETSDPPHGKNLTHLQSSDLYVTAAPALFKKLPPELIEFCDLATMYLIAIGKLRPDMLPSNCSIQCAKNSHSNEVCPNLRHMATCIVKNGEKIGKVQNRACSLLQFPPIKWQAAFLLLPMNQGPDCTAILLSDLIQIYTPP